MTGRIRSQIWTFLYQVFFQKEALLSSQIEGTQATLEDIFDPDRSDNINADVADVVNYTRATNYAIKRLDTLPLCNRLLLETHEVLLSGVRGQEKNPGEFRKSQNWLGGQGSSLKNARYIPPNLEDMKRALGDLESYINTDDNLDVLVRAALIHYQFETIHPFLDGNGRIGRLLVVLYLLETGAMSTPALYLSYYLKLNRIEYYDRMTAVRETGDYDQWVKFFVRGIGQSAQSALETADDLISLRKKARELIIGQGYSKRSLDTSLRLYDYVLAHPIISISKTARDLDLAYNTVKAAIGRLEDLDILIKTREREAGMTYSYKAYLDILRDGTEKL